MFEFIEVNNFVVWCSKGVIPDSIETTKTTINPYNVMMVEDLYVVKPNPLRQCVCTVITMDSKKVLYTDEPYEAFLERFRMGVMEVDRAPETIERVRDGK